MPSRKFSIHCILGILAVTFLISCVPRNSPNLTGKWQEIGRKAILEFGGDHTFKAADDMGMAVSGTYTLDRNGNLHLEINHGDSSAEPIDVKITFADNELILNYGDEGMVEKYMRVEP